MRFAVRWAALLSLTLGVGAAIVFADEDGPLAPKSLSVCCQGEGSALSYNGTTWETAIACYCERGLDLLRPTFVRGPARIHVVAGTDVEVPKGSVVLVSWEPAVRGWRFVAVTGDFAAYFTNTSVCVCQGRSITLTNGGELYRAPNGYAPTGAIGLVGLPEVSGFRPFEDDVR